MKRPIDIARLRLMLASLELWLCDLLVWLADACGETALGKCAYGARLCASVRARILEDLRRAENGVRGAVVLLAIQRAGMPPEPPGGANRRAFHPFTPPKGCALRRERGNPVSKLAKILKLGGRDLRARIARLRAVAADIDAHAARVCKRLLRAPKGRLVLVAARAGIACPQRPHAGPPAPDTS